MDIFRLLIYKKCIILLYFVIISFVDLESLLLNYIYKIEVTIIPPLYSSFDTGEKIPLKLWINFHTAFPTCFNTFNIRGETWTNAKKTI